VSKPAIGSVATGFVTRHSYHHGYFDGVEREFRGFGRVEQIDTEELAALTSSGTFPDATNVDAASYVPPVLTKTWFHTGVYLHRDVISKHFEHEYYREPELSDAQFGAMLLDDTTLPDGLSVEEEREACRALKGSVLRQETYALDGSEAAARPYGASERSYSVKRLQAVGANRHAVFLTHERETINLHYERKLYGFSGKLVADPRVSHALTLAVDDFGNVLQSVAIGYGRRHDDPDPLLSEDDRARQRRNHLTFTESRYTNAIAEADAQRTPSASESKTFELLGFAPNGSVPEVTNLFRLEELLSKLAPLSSGAGDLPYEQWETDESTLKGPARRVIDWVRQLYYRDDLSGPLPLGSIESLALSYESYKLALTSSLIASIFVRDSEPLLPDPAAVLSGDGGYTRGDTVKALGFFPSSDALGYFWICSGQPLFAPVAKTASPIRSPQPLTQSAAFARAHFFVPWGARDAFGAINRVEYDAYDLLLARSEDPLQNTVVVELDYRVLQPFRMTDPNGNRVEVAFDVFGLVAGSALLGKVGAGQGDSLVDFKADLTQSEIDAWFASPRGPPAGALLGSATTRILYDADRFYRSGDPQRPSYAATLARETHVADLQPGHAALIQVSLSYSDGFGREIQKKLQAEPGPLVAGGASVSARWVASGWTIFNNKGKAVRKYEPFFDDTHDFRFGNQVGVSSTLFYDPVERVVATLHPNHTYEKVVFEPWRQESWDVNDTVLQTDPGQDTNVGDFFRRLPDSDYLPTWYEARKTGQLGAAHQTAARRASAHADTPTLAFPDALGRTCLTLAHNGKDSNGVEARFATRVVLDVEGNQRQVIDAKGRIVVTYDYDLLSNKLHQLSMEAGARWMLGNVRSRPIAGWDGRGHFFQTSYDALLRPLQSTLRQAAKAPIVTERTLYGESVAKPEQLNLRGKAVQHFDSSGIARSVHYDFKGNLLEATRQLVSDYTTVPDWSKAPALDLEIFTSRTTFDALNRPLEIFTPDNGSSVIASVVRPTYNAANLLERVDVTLSGAALPTPFVTNIDYDAKGQRTRIDYGSGVKTEYEHEPATFRLARLITTRSGFPQDQSIVQDLSYAYDPAGNITHIQDDADLQNTIFFNNQRVEPSNDYVYDATYRLLQASGREHIGQVGAPQSSWNDEFRTQLPHPSDGQAMRRYTEEYDYDEVGNILSVTHHSGELPLSGQGFGPVLWRRNYAYKEASLIEPALNSNRLSSTTVGSTNPIPETYTYDAHGNMLSMSHLPIMAWDYKDQLQATQRQVVNNGSGERTYYVYNSTGERARKVTVRANSTRKSERIYLGGFELYREYDGAAVAPSLQRETLHVMDDKQRIALVETRTIDTAGNDQAPRQLMRYQFDNHLGSASLELNEHAQTISYEEYAPYGSSTYQAARSQTETAKRYRYTGKERDEETGFSYHGARYYSPWLGRWTATDPLWRESRWTDYMLSDIGDGDVSDSDVSRRTASIADVNLYAYVNGRVIVAVDRSGLSPTRALSTTASRWKQAFERKVNIEGTSYDRGGTTEFSAAEETIKKYGKTTGFLWWTKPVLKSWMVEKSDETPTGESQRYIYTKKGGWIDMQHFLFYAGRARINLDKYRDQLDTLENRAKMFLLNKMQGGDHVVDFNEWVDAYARDLALQATNQEGRIQEFKDSQSSGVQKLSAYSYEDLPSDNLGADFALNAFDPNSTKTLAEQIDAYLQKLNATEPQVAPNWADVPEEYVSPHPAQNYSKNPMYTTEP
jgi:RHS repeat-associated protein